MAPMVSHLKDWASWRPGYAQNTCFDAALQFARTEGIIPAPESTTPFGGDDEHSRRARARSLA